MTQVAVCICTYRRQRQLATLLDSLAAQRFASSGDVRLHVIVVDNDSEPTAASCCADFAAGGGVARLVYHHEPRRGISFARNTSLDLVPDAAEFVAITDDDAVADPLWIDRLLVTQRQTDADVVLGPSIATFAEHMPAWLAASGCFDKPPNYRELPDMEEAQTGSTCNLFMRAAALRESGLRFHPELSLSGGEDRLFLHELKLAGYRMIWSDTARIFEPVTPARATLGYLCRESYRRGLTSIWVKNYMRRRQGKSPGLTRTLRDLWKGVAESAGGAFDALIHWLKPDREKRLALAACDAFRGLGIIAGVIGLKSRHYQ